MARASWLQARAAELLADRTIHEVYVSGAIAATDLPKPAEQHPLTLSGRKMIADFAWIDSMVMLELDGSQHYTESGLAVDEIRDKAAKSAGWIVIRLPNSDVGPRLGNGGRDWLLELRTVLDQRHGYSTRTRAPNPRTKTRDEARRRKRAAARYPADYTPIHFPDAYLPRDCMACRVTQRLCKDHQP